ncbi:MAG: AraC family transcriptional regulator [Lachnospiraceae bacterium]|nr:MAG: AraC family transcriptional regulator [Lachnospiraceae bacterium]
MKDKDFLVDCQREYSSRKYLITGISMQEKQKGKHISYDTTHSAFIYTIGGEALIHFNDQIFHATADVVIHGAKNQKVSFDVISKESFIHLNVYYDPEVPWYGYSDIMNSVYKISNFGQDISEQLLSKLKASVERSSFDDQLHNNIIAKQLILSSFGYSMINREILQIENAVELMEKNYNHSLKLEDLAGVAKMNKSHFSYTFNKIYNIRPIDYLIRLRLRKAVNLLLTGMSVTDTAISVGYQDPLYFSRLYKKYFGIPPSQTLKNSKENALLSNT